LWAIEEVCSIWVAVASVMCGAPECGGSKVVWLRSGSTERKTKGKGRFLRNDK
jgi:hypothetical protein